MGGAGREVRTGVEGFAFRREKTIERPAAAAGQYLTGIHVNRIHVGAFLPIHFDIDKPFVHECRNVLIFK